MGVYVHVLWRVWSENKQLIHILFWLFKYRKCHINIFKIKNHYFDKVGTHLTCLTLDIEHVFIRKLQFGKLQCIFIITLRYSCYLLNLTIRQ